MKQVVFTSDGVGDGLAAALVVGAAAALVVSDAGLVEAAAGVVLAEALGVAEADGDAELLADALALALALMPSVGTYSSEVSAEGPPADDADVTGPEPADVVDSACTLPAGVPSPPPVALPNNRNAPTAIPANPPVSISPTPRRFSSRALRRSWLADREAGSSSTAAARPLPACEPPPRAPRFSAAFAAARVSARVGRGAASASTGGRPRRPDPGPLPAAGPPPPPMSLVSSASGPGG